jgi:hypothetical protein
MVLDVGKQEVLMKKVLGLVAMFVGLGALAKLLGPRVQSVDWEKRFEAMPDNAPPKWIFRNVTAIRENTDRILAIVEQQQSVVRQPPTQGVPQPPPGIRPPPPRA